MGMFKTESLPGYLTTPEAAQLPRLSERTLEKHRLDGAGVAFRKIGGRVRIAVIASLMTIPKHRLDGAGICHLGSLVDSRDAY